MGLHEVTFSYFSYLGVAPLVVLLSKHAYDRSVMHGVIQDLVLSSVDCQKMHDGIFINVV